MKYPFVVVDLTGQDEFSIKPLHVLHDTFKFVPPDKKSDAAPGGEINVLSETANLLDASIVTGN